MVRIPQIAPLDKLCHLVTFSLLEELYPHEQIAHLPKKRV